MANYHQIKNAAILTPSTNQDLGSDTNRYSNVFMSGNIVLNNSVVVTSNNAVPPRITSITYPGSVTAANPAGGETITITGTNFINAGGIPTVIIGTTVASVVSYVSSTTITFTTPALSAGTYLLTILHSDGAAAIFASGISYSGTPNWTNAAGSIGSVGSAASASFTVAATGDAPITYAVKAGSSLPSGLSLNSSTGAITGTAPTVANATTYNFTLTATDLQNQTTDRSFSIDVVVVPSSLQYIVVAGGGSGGGYGGGSGGGGAGGYRSSITGESSGRGASAESAITGIASGVTYTITVGAGGASVSGEEVTGFKGGNSSISGSGITTITSLGGGAGGPNSSGYSPRNYATEGLGNGGSGGGAAQMMGSPTVQGLGTAGQGYDAGTNDSNSPGSGGGGAGGQGGAASTMGFGGFGVKSNVTISFTGTASVSSSNNTLTVTAVSAGIIDVGTQVTGTGIPAGAYIISRGTGTGSTGTYYMNANGIATNTGVAITSTGRYYAGGGAGCTAGYGGAGGGGANPGQTGAIANCTLNGAENTGGGGGGQNPSGAGGKGIVIIRHSAGVTATCTGSPIITTSGGYTVYQFNNSGSMIF
jgi:fibronectin-binding autotransporter adhesin